PSAAFLEFFAAAAGTRIVAAGLGRRTSLKYYACGRRWCGLELLARRSFSLVETRPPTHLRFNIRDHAVSVFQESQAGFFPAGQGVLDIVPTDVSRLDIAFFVGAADLVHDLLRPEVRARGGKSVPDHGRLRLEDVEQPVKICHHLLTFAQTACNEGQKTVQSRRSYVLIGLRILCQGGHTANVAAGNRCQNRPQTFSDDIACQIVYGFGGRRKYFHQEGISARLAELRQQVHCEDVDHPVLAREWPGIPCSVFQDSEQRWS